METCVVPLARTNGGELPAGAATPDNREQASAPPGTPGMPTPDNQELAITRYMEYRRPSAGTQRVYLVNPTR